MVTICVAWRYNIRNLSGNWPVLQIVWVSLGNNSGYRLATLFWISVQTRVCIYSIFLANCMWNVHKCSCFWNCSRDQNSRFSRVNSALQNGSWFLDLACAFLVVFPFFQACHYVNAQGSQGMNKQVMPPLVWWEINASVVQLRVARPQYPLVLVDRYFCRSFPPSRFKGVCVTSSTRLRHKEICFPS